METPATAVPPVAIPALPKWRRDLNAVAVVVFIALFYAFQALWFLLFLPNIEIMLYDTGGLSNYPVLTRLFLEASNIAVRFNYVALLLFIALAAGHYWLFFNRSKKHRRLGVILMCLWPLVWLLEIYAIMPRFGGILYMLPRK